MLPVVVDLAGRPVLVIGGGRVGLRKAAQLVSEGARVTVLSPELLADVPDGVAAVLARRYEPGDLAGYLLVVSATGDPEANDAIVAEARGRGLLVNVVDDSKRSDFYFAALHRQGDVVVAVSTEGAAPALAQWVRDRIAASLPANLAEVAEQLRAERRSMRAAGGSTEGIDWRPAIERALGQEDDVPHRTAHRAKGDATTRRRRDAQQV